MGQILLIQDPGEIRDRLVDNIEEALNLSVIIKDDVNSAMHLMSILPDIALTIFYSNDKTDKSQFIPFWSKLDHRPQLILVSEEDYPGAPNLFPYTFFHEKHHWLFVVKMIADIFQMDLYQIADNLIENYCAFASYDLYLFSQAPFDIYLREEIVHKQGSYSKLLKKNEAIDHVELRRKIESGVRSLYIQEDDLIPFLNLMVEKFDQKVETSALSSKELVFSARELHLQAIAVLNSIGKSTTLSELVGNSINTIVHAWIKKHRLSKLLNMVIRSDGSLLFQHFSIVSILACEMERARKGQISRDTIEQLTYAAFLHDISISYDFFLTQIVDSKVLSKSNLSHYDYLRVENHAKDSAALAKDLGIPNGVELLILHHHGSTDGVGFQHNFATGISPLVHILSIAERFSFSLLEAQYNSTEAVNVTKIINDLSLQLKDSSSAEYINLLKSVFIQEKKIENDANELPENTGQYFFNF